MLWNGKSANAYIHPYSHQPFVKIVWVELLPLQTRIIFLHVDFCLGLCFCFCCVNLAFFMFCCFNKNTESETKKIGTNTDDKQGIRLWIKSGMAPSPCHTWSKSVSMLRLLDMCRFRCAMKQTPFYENMTIFCDFFLSTTFFMVNDKIQL